MLLTIFAILVELFVQVFLWKALYNGKAIVGGIPLESVVTYVVLCTILNICTGFSVGEQLARGILEGTIAVDLLKPLSIKLGYAAQDLGRILSGLLFRALPVILAASALLKLQGPATVGGFLVSVLFLLFGMILVAYIETIFGLLAFWLQEIWYLRWFVGALYKLFSGSLVPIWFYPEWLSRISGLLPFQFSYYVPLSFFLGKLPLARTPGLLLSAVAWLLILFFVEQAIWRIGIRRTVINGG